MTTKRAKRRIQLANLGLSESDITTIEELSAKNNCTVAEFINAGVINSLMLASLRMRIREMAVDIASDYPDIASCDAWEQLHAIDCSHQGTKLAVDDLHSIIKNMVNDLGITDEQAYERYVKK